MYDERPVYWNGQILGALVFCNPATKDPRCSLLKTPRRARTRCSAPPAITERLGVSRSYWWAGVKAGKFPAGIKLSSRVTVWKRSDIDSLIARLGK